MKYLSEISIIILWSESLYIKDKIIADIKKKFEIIEITIIEWSENVFFENLFIFYNGELPMYSEKDKYSGNKPFYCIVIRDNNVKYENITTPLENNINININLHKAKELYRIWTNDGHKIHISDNFLETDYQLKLLFGKTYMDYLKIDNKNKINYLKQDLIYNTRIAYD